MQFSLSRTLVLVAALPAPVAAQTTFTAANHPAGPMPSAVAVGDLDSDGVVDAAHTHPNADALRANRNTGTGAAFTNTPLYSYAAGSRPVELVVDQIQHVAPPRAQVLGNRQVRRRRRRRRLVDHLGGRRDVALNDGVQRHDFVFALEEPAHGGEVRRVGFVRR